MAGGTEQFGGGEDRMVTQSVAVVLERGVTF